MRGKCTSRRFVYIREKDKEEVLAAARLVLMSGVFLLVEIDKNEAHDHVFAFDPQQQKVHLQ